MRSNGDSDVADVLVVCGPTAGGKSALAMWLADIAPITIVSADSRQVYRQFDIGTAKASTSERACVPHEGIDIAEPTDRFSAAAWAEGAERWISGARDEGRIPVVVGGTGLYLRALFDGLFTEPPLDADRRASLDAVLGSFPLAELRRWAEALDPARSHLGRTQLLRAVEIALLTGRRLSDLHRETTRTPGWRPRYLLVDPGPALAQRIDARIGHMLDHGWPDEVQRLMQTVPATAPAWNATGYEAVRRLVLGEASLDETRQRILIATRQYAKRQRTWFRHQLDFTRVTPVDSTSADWTKVVLRWAGLDAGARA